MRILVHAHIYYPELWPEIRKCLNNLLAYPCEIFITLPHHNNDLKKTLHHDIPTCHIIEVENKGFDVAPFFQVMRNVNLSEFDYIAKIHTKRTVSCIKNNHIFFKDGWRRKLLSPFSSKSLLWISLRRLESHPHIGMIAHPTVIFCHDDEKMIATADQILSSIDLHSTAHRFVAGTMFLAKTKALIPLMRQAFTIDNETAYVFERALGFSVSSSGYEISDPYGLLHLYEATYHIRGKLIWLLRLVYRISIKPLVKNIPAIRQLSNL